MTTDPLHPNQPVPDPSEGPQSGPGYQAPIPGQEAASAPAGAASTGGYGAPTMDARGADGTPQPAYGVPGAADGASAVAPAKKKSPVVPIVAGIAALAVVGGGIAWATGALNGGGGPQPSVVVPAGAKFYTSMDLDPTNAQKLAAVQFASKFPAVKDKKLDQNSDLRKAIFDAIAERDETLKKYDYDRDIKPWLGNRAALAAIPQDDGKQAVPSLVLAVTDKAKAQETLTKIAADEQNTECKVLDQFAVCSTKGKVDQAYVTDPAKSLHQVADFSGDLKAVNGDAVGTVWADLGAISKLSAANSATSGTAGAADIKGRLAGKLRFESGAAELAGVTKGMSQLAGSGETVGTDIGKLPEGTVAAASLNDLGDKIKAHWGELTKSESAQQQVQMAEEQLGVKLPDDLATLLGKHTTVAFGGTNGSQAPDVALITDGDASKLQQVVSTKLGSTSPLSIATKDGRTVVSPRQGTYGASVLGGSLGSSAAFKAALPGADKASSVVYVDVPKILSIAGTSGMDATTRENVEVLQAVGASANQTGDDGTFTYRVTTKG